MFAKAFDSSDIKKGDIILCTSCEKLMWFEHSHTYSREKKLCLECDLPERWYSKYSRKGKRYYVYFNPLQPSTSYVQWGHPTEGNPLHVPGDKGEPMIKRKKQKCQRF